MIVLLLPSVASAQLLFDVSEHELVAYITTGSVPRLSTRRSSRTRTIVRHLRRIEQKQKQEQPERAPVLRQGVYGPGKALMNAGESARHLPSVREIHLKPSELNRRTLQLLRNLEMRRGQPLR